MIPCVFVFSACGKNPKDPQDPETPPVTPPPATLEETLLNNAFNTLDNFTANVNASYEAKITQFENAQRGESVAMSDDIAGATLKIADNNFSFKMGNETYALIDGATYSIDTSEGKYVSYFESTMADQTLDLGAIIESIVGVIDGYETYDYVFDEDDKTLTFKVDFVQIVNNILEVVVENKDATLATLINEMVEKFTGSEFDVMAVVDEFEEFVTADPTLADVIDYVFDELGLQDDVKEYFVNNLRTSLDQQLMMSGGSFDALLEVTFQELLAMLEVEGNVFDVVDLYLNNPELTLNSLLAEVLQDVEEIDIDGLWTALSVAEGQKLEIAFVFEFDANNAVKSLDFDFQALMQVGEDDSNCYKLSCKAGFDATFSNVGTTTITLPTSNADVYDIGLVLKVDYEELVANGYKINVADRAILADMNTSDWDEDSWYVDTIYGYSENIGFVTYNSTTKELVLNSAALEEILTENEGTPFIEAYNQTSDDWIYITILFV